MRLNIVEFNCWYPQDWPVRGCLRTAQRTTPRTLFSLYLQQLCTKNFALYTAPPHPLSLTHDNIINSKCGNLTGTAYPSASVDRGRCAARTPGIARDGARLRHAGAKRANTDADRIPAPSPPPAGGVVNVSESLSCTRLQLAHSKIGPAFRALTGKAAGRFDCRVRSRWLRTFDASVNAV